MDLGTSSMSGLYLYDSVLTVTGWVKYSEAHSHTKLIHVHTFLTTYIQLEYPPLPRAGDVEIDESNSPESSMYIVR